MPSIITALGGRPLIDPSSKMLEGKGSVIQKGREGGGKEKGSRKE